jgi:HAD superfamily hydrolase (TIGR01450 family)
VPTHPAGSASLPPPGVTALPLDGDLHERLRRVRGVVFDMDGTLVMGDRHNNGLAPLPGARELTAELSASGLPWVTLTNGTTRTPEEYARTLRSIGFDLPDDTVLTPATSAVEVFRAEGHRRVVVLGGGGLREPLRQAGIEVVAPEGKPMADAVLAGWFREFSMDNLESACHAVFGGARLYSCSQSVFFATAEGTVLGTSRAICAMITSITGVREVVVGKPSLDALRCAAHRLGADPADLLVVGDDPELEMAMAHAGGALAVGVAGGVHPVDEFAALPPDRRPHFVIDGVGELLPALTR